MPLPKLAKKRQTKLLSEMLSCGGARRGKRLRLPPRSSSLDRNWLLCKLHVKSNKERKTKRCKGLS